MLTTINKQILIFFDSESYKELLVRFIISLLSLFSPVAPILCCIVFLVILDFITAIIASIKNGIMITSSKMSRTISKTIVYSISIIITHLLDVVILKDFNIGISISSISAAFICITEALSILENMTLISDKTALPNIITFLSSEYRHNKNNSELFRDIKNNIKKKKQKKTISKFNEK